MKSNDKKITDKSTIANSFCTFFSTVGTNLQNQIISLKNRRWKCFQNNNLRIHSRHTNSFHFKRVSPISIDKILKALNPSKASGPDDIPASMLKDAHKELAVPLCYLVNVSLETGIFPTAEKLAKITPIYKSGERSTLDNYRPISILNIISKVLEKIVCQQISEHLESENLLYQHQYGFRKNKCTQDAVLHIHDHIRQNMDKKNFTGALYIDLRKAFDTVTHSGLLSKLPYYGITGIELTWITDYLFNRKQFVCIDQISSSNRPFNLGVPQGSVLGPLLFVLLINDSHQSLQKCTMLTYADDTVLLFSSTSTLDIEETLTREGELLFRWFQENDLIVNLKPGKTEVVIYGTARNLKSQSHMNINILGSKINQERRYEYLGVTLDEHMTLAEQSIKIVKRANQRVNLLKRIRTNISSTTAQTIYRSMIEPIILYCAPIYLGIIPIQKKLSRIEIKAYDIINIPITKNIVNKLNERSAIEVFKYVRGIKCSNNIHFKFFNHAIETRGNGNRLIIPKTKNEAGKRSFSVQGALIFNQLPKSLRTETSICNFKRHVNNVIFS